MPQVGQDTLTDSRTPDAQQRKYYISQNFRREFCKTGMATLQTDEELLKD